MKRTLLYISILLLAAACKREALTTYDVKDNVYFNNQAGSGNFVDTADFTFAYSDASVTDTIIRVSFGVTGLPAATDRSFDVVVDPASTAVAGTHYELPSFVFRAGRVVDTMNIKLLRTLDLATSTKKLVLHLRPNESFNTALLYRVMGMSVFDTVSIITFAITTSDIMNSGPAWDDTYARFFGTFSLIKMRMIHDLLGMPLNFWSTATLTSAQTPQAIYYASTMGRYLNDQASQGNVILDEDGAPMKMAAAYQ